MSGEAEFAEQLLAWFAQRKRDLPWRRSNDPYHVWVSEIMLQQTRVETVIPYFQRFIARFPSIAQLADAPEADVLKLWEGLGYYSRARNLQAAVREVQATYGGQVPATRAHIAALPGVGPYTAGAILSIAYGMPEPAVDGNVLRVMARYFCLQADIAKPKTRTLVEDLVRPLIPAEAAGDFTQALMELGSLVCVPKSPRCEQCPIASGCQARSAGVQCELPVKSKAKRPRPEYRVVALIERPDGAGDGRQFWVRKRPATGLLADMWELPHVELSVIADSLLLTEANPRDEAQEQSYEKKREQAEIALLQAECAARYGLHLRAQGFFMEIEHVFSHIHWHLRVYRFEAEVQEEQQIEEERVRWLTVSEFNRLAFPLVFTKIMKRGLML